MEIKVMKILIITYHFHGPLKFNFGKINNQKFAFMGKVISPRIFLKMFKFGYERCKKSSVNLNDKVIFRYYSDSNGD